jgi:hypothetical protein
VVADPDLSGNHRARDDRTGALQCEATVDGETEGLVGRCGCGLAGLGDQLLPQFPDAFARHRGNPDDFRSFEPGAQQSVGDVVAEPPQAVAIDEIGLGQRHQPAPNAEQVEDREMLARLRHDAIIGRDHQQRVVDAGRARQHVVDELLVAGHIDEADDRLLIRLHIGEAEIDGDPACLLLLEAVGIDAGQCPHQRGLAVIDVPGGANDHGTVSGIGSRARRRASSSCAGDTARSALGMKGWARSLPPSRPR